MGVRAALAVLFLCVATVEADATVEFSGQTFKMTCPEEGKWYKDNMLLGENISFERIYNSETKGPYHCVYKDITHYFYVKGKACENCVELDPIHFGLVIFGDVVMTVILMMIIYKCTKKRGSGGTTTPSAPARRGGRAPPVPSTDYEPLNPHTRNEDPYSVANRMDG